MGYTARIRATSAMLVWNDEIAPSLAVASRATFVRGKTLYVTVEKPVWAQQLSMMKRGLVQRINASAGKDAIRDIRFRSGQVRAPLVWGADSEAGLKFPSPSAQEEGVPDWKSMPADEGALSTAANASRPIGDPEVREKFSDLMITDAKWRAWSRQNLSSNAVKAADILKKEPWLSDSHLASMVPGASSDDLIRARDAAAQELRREIASLVAVDRLESRFASGISEAPTGKSSCLHKDATDRGVDSLGRQGIVGDAKRLVRIRLLVESLAMLVAGEPPDKIDEELVERVLGSEYADLVRYLSEEL
jgi:hypothetical protein